MSQKFKHSDQVWHRVVQIVQEAMIMGVDCVDLLRQIEVMSDDKDNLVLTPEYIRSVGKMHEKWLADAVRLQEDQTNAKNVVIDPNMN